jgi:O-antigen/teichoic acid export membrane protein
MQRLIILLGHPTYSLSVVLFAVLVSSGIGSYLTQSGANIAPRMIALIAILVLTGLLTPALITRHVASPTATRIAIALLLLMPAGLFMGMCFPLGMQVAATRRQDLTAWLWGINGAMSVVASVLSVVISMTYGISATWWTGVAFYALALLAITRALSNSRPLPSVTPVPT